MLLIMLALVSAVYMYLPYKNKDNMQRNSDNEIISYYSSLHILENIKYTHYNKH